MSSWIVEFAADDDPGRVFSHGRHRNASVALVEAFAKLPASFHRALQNSYEQWTMGDLGTAVDVGVKHLTIHRDEGTYPVTLIDGILQLRIMKGSS